MHARTTGRRGAWVLLIGLGVGLGICLSLAVTSMAEETSRATRSVLGGAASGGSSASSNAGLEKKLDQILANQETILQRFDQVMEELRIIKVRATLRGGS